MSGLKQRARIDAVVKAQMDAHMMRTDRAHPSGMTAIRQINANLSPLSKALADAEFDAMDSMGELPADWEQRRAAIVAAFGGAE
jgi:hypothetical protein